MCQCAFIHFHILSGMFRALCEVLVTLVREPDAPLTLGLSQTEQLGLLPVLWLRVSTCSR